MDVLQFLTTYTILTIVAFSVSIVVLSFSPGSTSKQIALIGELKNSVEHARQSCERARSAALWSAGKAGEFVRMGNLTSLPPEPGENGFVDHANHLIQALKVVTADSGDLRVSALRRRLAEIKRIESDSHALLFTLQVSEKPDANDTQTEAHPDARFQRLIALD